MQHSDIPEQNNFYKLLAIYAKADSSERYYLDSSIDKFIEAGEIPAPVDSLMLDNLCQLHEEQQKGLLQNYADANTNVTALMEGIIRKNDKSLLTSAFAVYNFPQENLHIMLIYSKDKNCQLAQDIIKQQIQKAQDDVMREYGKKDEIVETKQEAPTDTTKDSKKKKKNIVKKTFAFFKSKLKTEIKDPGTLLKLEKNNN